MQSIEYNKENHFILNQKGHLSRTSKPRSTNHACKVGNENADKLVKQAIYMTITIPPYTDYYLTIRRARNSNTEKTVLSNYTT